MQPEFVTPSISFGAILPEIILGITAFAVLLTEVFVKDKPKNLLGIISIIGAVIATLTIFPLFGSNEVAFNGMIFVDGFTNFFAITVCFILILTILLSLNYQQYFTNINNGEYYSLMFFSAMGMIFMAAAGNLIMLFVALELMSIPIYVLTGFNLEKGNSLEAALKYFLLGAFSSAFLLLGFAYIYGAVGSMDITEMTNYIQSNPEIFKSGLFIAGMILTIAGLGFKISMVPFHMWTPDVYEGAPTTITAFMATGVKAAAFAALIRIFLVPLSTLPIDWTAILWVASLLTMTVGNVIALIQDSIKRMLAYSSIAHAGYLLIGFVAGTNLGQAGILYYLLAYAFMNVGAFGVLILLGKQDQEFNTFSDFAGMGLHYPGMGLAMAIFMFSLAGIPPTAGFMGKLYIFTAGIKSGFIWLVIFGAVNSLISIYYYLRVVVVMYFHKTDTEAMVTPSSTLAIKTALSLSVLGVLIMGIFPSMFWSFAQNSVFIIP